LIDGEAVALDENGVSNFSKMQDAVASSRTASLVFFAFDLLHLNGRDLRKIPVLDRKAKLLELFEGHAGERLQFSEHIIGAGASFFKTACDHGLEGIVSKLANAPYVSGRSDAWRKTKCVKRQEFVVGGWLPREEDPRDLAALLVGYFVGRKFLFAGKVGTGFDAKTRKQLIAGLSPIRRDSDPFEETPKQYRERVRWAEPRVVVEVVFTEFTDDGLIRHGTFRGIREDKKPEDVRLEIARNIPEPGVIASSTARWRRAKHRS
jgi:bifunctional non-homologous end joining protein LigD